MFTKVYLRNDGDRVILAGNIANDVMIQNGFVLFEGTIPDTQEFEYLILIDNKLIIKKDEYLLRNIVLNNVKDHINIITQRMGFNNIDEIFKFLGFDNDYRNLAEELASWNANVLNYTNIEIKKYLNNERENFSSYDFIQELPKFRNMDIFNITV